MKQRKFNLNILKDNKKRLCYAFIISFFLSFIFVIGFQIEKEHLISFGISTVFLFCLEFFFYFIIIFFLYFYIDSYTKKVNRFDISNKLVGGLTYIFLTIIYIFALLGIFPGIFAFDSTMQFLMYKYNMISEHHPVLHTLLLGYIVDSYSYKDNYNIGAFVYSIIQILVMSLGFSSVCFFVYKKTKNIIFWVISIIFYAFFPPIQLQVLSATKDSIFVSFLNKFD